ncbi:uncharacterized protein LOC126770033 [Nymphalis io]|uniref:uncharacterized protein LOC126770033 n=1 Tax=Inachis io TaxID=171585 RepID=UPI0021694364|nr:uncharacterized protein LOC126770033 [Nymphalis io]
MHAQCLRNKRTLKTNTTRLLLEIFVAFNFIKNIYTAPPDYCLQSLNTSECNFIPIKVFSYYKPGSRCELEEWRGCPSDNKFDTEEECKNVCIKSYSFGYEKSKKVFYNGGKKAKCVTPLNIYNCNNNATKAFVYNKAINNCDEIIWTGCPHMGNVFEEKLDCLQTCYRGDLNWHEKLSIMSNKQADQLETILNNISIEDSDATANHTKPNHVTGNNQLLLKTETQANKQQSAYTEKVIKYQNINNLTDNQYFDDIKILNDKFNGTTITTNTVINDKDDKELPFSASKKINDINTSESPVDRLIDITNYLSTTEYLKTTNTKFKPNDVHKEVNVTNTDYTNFESPTIEISTTNEVQSTVDVTESTKVDITKAEEIKTSITKEITQTTRIRTTPIKVGTAKAVVLPQDL